MINIKILGAGTTGLFAAAVMSLESNVSVEVYEISKEIGWRYKNCIQAIRNYEDKQDIQNFS